MNLRFRGKNTVKLNDCFLGKTSLAKNFQMFFRGGRGSFENFSSEKLKILNQTIFFENLKNFQTKYLVQLAGKDSEIFAQNFLIGTEFKNLRKFLEIREFCKNLKNIPLNSYRQSINMSVWKNVSRSYFFLENGFLYLQWTVTKEKKIVFFSKMNTFQPPQMAVRPKALLI